jgi:DNA-binding transcriptional regulator GbsR (MarR family)
MQEGNTEVTVDSNIPPEWENEIIALFTSMASMFGFRKSVGTIYGYMFCQEKPLNLEAIMVHLSMSKGTVSQGLTFLRKVGAVRLAFVPGDRKEHFIPEISLKKLVAGFLRDQVDPHLVGGEDRLANLEQIVSGIDGEVPEIIEERMKRLRSWQRQAKMLLPIVQKFLDVGS